MWKEILGLIKEILHVVTWEKKKPQKKLSVGELWAKKKAGEALKKRG